MLTHMPTGRQSQFIIVLIFTVIVMSFYYFGVREETFQKSDINVRTIEKSLLSDKRVSPGYLVFTPGCRIPEMYPFDKSVMKYLESASTIQCSDKPPLIRSDQTRIWVESDALGTYNITQVEDLNCCYKPFSRPRVDDKQVKNNIDDSISISVKCRPFTRSANIYYEFVEVTCEFNDVLIYKDYHAFIVPKKPLSKQHEKSNDQKLSVLIVGVDSLSRLNFYRQMPRTKDFLHSIGAIEFYGYNKVQDNTFPNLVPLLSGYSVKEIREFCWLNDSAYFDDCPWIWKNYSSYGFNTVFAEDCVNIGLFNYLKNGFIQQPTDYYLRPYMDANERFIGHMKLLNTRYCCGSRFTVEVLMDYAYKFTINMTESDNKFWAFIWESSLTHDFLNVPANNDNLYFSFFKEIEEQNVLNSTFIIFMSDHGMRWGSIRETYQGRLEEHLPFLFLLIPKWFQEKYGLALRNLRRNTHLLTTHFDVHELMKDLLELDKLKDENLESRILETRSDRGISLFLPMPLNRTCESAGIEKTWCTCQTNKKVSTTNRKVRKAAKMSVVYLNSIMTDYKRCATLKLNKVLSAHQEDEEEMLKDSSKDKFTDYVVVFETTPGLAKFEATVRHRSGSNEMTVLGDISRINIYGSQSHCVDNYRLKRYCYCT